MMKNFELKSRFKPVKEQLAAVSQITKNLNAGERGQVLLGVTGSGKTFTLANVIEKVNRPTLVISHNKTLAAQLYSELKEFFPNNAVEYFVSYYDYYQPEAYIPQKDIYIEKDASINDRLDRLRLSATTSLMTRRDVIVVSSVSCIYNLGSAKEYSEFILFLNVGDDIDRDVVLERLIDIQYERSDFDFKRGSFRVRGDIVEVYPAYRQDALRIEFFGDEVESIKQIHPISGNVIEKLDSLAIYPAKHFIVGKKCVGSALKEIKKEMIAQVKSLRREGRLVESERLESRTKYDIEMIKEMGYCNGIENYSRYLSGRSEGSRPSSLIEYFPEDFITLIDESHVTIPQINGMYNGDRSRKMTLVDYGFRLPSCLDNRPLKFKEFEDLVQQTIYVSATPGPYEIDKYKGKCIEQIIRPTGIVDPPIEVRPTSGQVDDLIKEIQLRAKKNERVLVTTLTKRMSEDLTEYLQDKKIRVKYLHSDIKTIDRIKILRDLRLRKYDCLVGVNLLREGLDLPEVSLVVIFDADKQGFLRSQTALIQTSGRAARNVNGRVIMYADTMSQAMKGTIDECSRRRKIQIIFNERNNITPKTIKRAMGKGIDEGIDEDDDMVKEENALYGVDSTIMNLERDMENAARNLQFEKAARFRDKIKSLKTGTEDFSVRKSNKKNNKSNRGRVSKVL